MIDSGDIPGEINALLQQANARALYQEAITHFKQGHLEKAETFARGILANNMNDANANQLLGLIAAKRGQVDLAHQFISRASNSNPGQSLYFKNLGLALHQGGHLDEALAAYEQAIRIEPQLASAHNNYGNVLRDLGRLEDALAAYEQAIRYEPQLAPAHNNRGNVLQNLDRLDEALAACEEAIRLNPGLARAHSNRGNALQELGHPKDALAAYEQAIRLEPQHAQGHYNLGRVLQELGRPKDALAAYEQAIRLEPQLALAHNNYGNVLRDLGRPEDALAAYERAIRYEPQLALAHNNRGNVLWDLGRMDEALAACEEAIRLNPGLAGAHSNRGNVLRDLGRRDEALAAYEQAIRYKPQFALAHSNRGNVLWGLGRPVEALAACEEAVRLNPLLAGAYLNRGNTLKDLGRVDEAEDSYRRALQLEPDNAGAHSSLLFLQAGRIELSPDQLLEEQRCWDRMQGRPGRLNPLSARAGESVSGRRLRIGYVSPDLRRHAVSYFFEPLLVAHDRSQFEIFCYANVANPDTTTARLREHAEHWRSVVGYSDAELARCIHEDGIDILVDLAGHTAGNRIRAFTYRPAPVQATYLGYFAGTGLAAMDYWITDEVLHPPDTPEQTVERIYRLPRCSHCFQPPEEDLPVSPCPNMDDRVVFGSFSHLSKLTPAVIEAWSQLLRTLPGSRLLLTTRLLGEPQTRQLLLERFTCHGIQAEQLLIQHTLHPGEWLATYAGVDIVLDPFPRTGCTTTAEALWMGVPVVTLAGQRYVERASAMVLAAVGLEELITRNREEYLGRAVSLARDPARRKELRATLRDTMARSPLCDAPGLACSMETAYQTMWDRFLSRVSCGK